MVDNNDEVNVVAQLFLKLMIWPQISHLTALSFTQGKYSRGMPGFSLTLFSYSNHWLMWCVKKLKDIKSWQKLLTPVNTATLLTSEMNGYGKLRTLANGSTFF